MSNISKNIQCLLGQHLKNVSIVCDIRTGNESWYAEDVLEREDVDDVGVDLDDGLVGVKLPIAVCVAAVWHDLIGLDGGWCFWQVGVEGGKYTADDAKLPTLLGVGGGEKTHTASGTLRGEATSGVISLLRYPLSRAFAYHVCANETAMSQMKISVIALVVAVYPTRLELVATDTLCLILWAVTGPLPGHHSPWMWNITEPTACSLSNALTYPRQVSADNMFY